jgi:phosphatidylserine/phosphatidylglycerophosphate/cardiolipin synthase-like enzyme
VEAELSNKTATQGQLTVTAYIGDAKTLLAFNLPKQSAAKNLAGFTISCTPKGQQSYYLLNDLQFQTPGDHAQDASQPANATINAPIHKFRWLHVPGSFHQGTTPYMGPYTYTVTPRYFDSKQSMQPLDSSLSASVTVPVGPFVKSGVELGFTRGFVQSQAFVNHFGPKALISPKGAGIDFDTSVVAGSNAQGQKYTYAQEYAWLGYTARAKIFDLLNTVLKDKTLNLDVFAYDLNEPDLIAILLTLAKQGRLRVILDNASLHHNAAGTKREDQFEAAFNAAAKGKSAIIRGKFGSFAHDKVLLVSKAGVAQKVLGGSTNFSVNGMYVNSNHIVVFNDPKVAMEYSLVFNEAWADKATMAFQNSALATAPFSITSKLTPKTEITFSPHTQAYADQILQDIVDRIEQEKTIGNTIGSVLFAVMQLTGQANTVYNALKALHKNGKIYSYGISDTTSGIALYKPGNVDGVLVTGKPLASQLPPPFNQVPTIGLEHQVHHKFIVCGFNGADPVVYFGSSNFANSGEHKNGDNLIAMYDGDVATTFAIEALALVDHFDFLNKYPAKTTGKTDAADVPAPANKRQAALSSGWFLSTNDKWTLPYYDPKDLHCMDRKLFG